MLQWEVRSFQWFRAAQSLCVTPRQGPRCRLVRTVQIKLPRAKGLQMPKLRKLKAVLQGRTRSQTVRGLRSTVAPKTAQCLQTRFAAHLDLLGRCAITQSEKLTSKIWSLHPNSNTKSWTMSLRQVRLSTMSTIRTNWWNMLTRHLRITMRWMAWVIQTILRIGHEWSDLWPKPNACKKCEDT